MLEFLPFTCEVRPDRDRVILRLAGELDLATAPQFRSALDDLIDVGFGRVILDLRELEFMDSTGLKTLIRAHGTLSTREGRLSLVGANEQVRRLLQVTGTEELFTLESARALR